MMNSPEPINCAKTRGRNGDRIQEDRFREIA